MLANIHQCFGCLPSFIRKWHSWKSWQKNKNQCSKISFFPTTSTNVIPLWNLASTENIGQSLRPIFFRIFRIFRIFLEFTIHAKVIWAKTKMGIGQHFFHECKWHAPIGDVFLNILISYLNFSELVWSFYEVFKVMVKRSKGKSIRGAKCFGRNKCFRKLGVKLPSVTQLGA